MRGDFALGAGFGVGFAGFGHALTHRFDFGVCGGFEVETGAAAGGLVGLEGGVHLGVEGSAAACTNCQYSR